MAPAKPLAYTAGSNPVFKFDKAFEITKHPAPPGRAIHFHCLVHPHHPRLKALEASGKKPPTHFHPHQWEYFKVIRGALTVEINGVARVFTEKDGEYALPPGPHHCIYGTPGQEGEVCEFWLGASRSGGVFELDQAFFENWYGYQEDVMLRGVKPDPIQVMCMFDAGDSYLSPPAWVPFRHFIGYWMGVIIGRWIGGLLGYQPFFPEWTTDWDSACMKMKSHWTQKRFAVPGAQEKARKHFLDRGESVGNGGLYKSPDGVSLGNGHAVSNGHAA